MLSQQSESLSKRWYNIITTPKSTEDWELQRLASLEKYKSERKLHENDFSIYFYKYIEAQTDEEIEAVENEIAQALVEGVALRVKYQRTKASSQWFYAMASISNIQKVCQ